MYFWTLLLVTLRYCRYTTYRVNFNICDERRKKWKSFVKKKIYTKVKVKSVCHQFHQQPQWSPHLSSAIFASGRGGLGGATSSSCTSGAASAGAAAGGVLFETSCSPSIEGTSDETLLGTEGFNGLNKPLWSVWLPTEEGFVLTSLPWWQALLVC